MNASSIESGSTCGVSSNISLRTSRPTRTYFAMSGGSTIGVRAELARLEHRHRRMHAEGARDVAGGRDHAALAAADDQRLVGERRVVALLDRGVEGVAIDMRDRRARSIARAGAAAASRRPCSAIALARPPQSSRGRSPPWDHGASRCQGRPLRTACACSTSCGATPACSATAISRASSPQTWSSTPARNAVPPPPCESSPDRYL